mmetsp:Transcript_40011/g.92119  ORF Transcript_40011/g.92119 Transcript_40011/m.92119 type:complete len:95 (-) Transcript_40011:125-409(-)
MGCCGSSAPKFQSIDPPEPAGSKPSQADAGHTAQQPQAAAAPSPAQPQLRTVAVQIPTYAVPGTNIEVETPEGTILNIEVPPGLEPGQTVSVQY